MLSLLDQPFYYTNSGVGDKGGGDRGVAERRTRGGEMLAVSWRASAMKGEEVRHFHEVAGVSIVAAGCLRSAVDTSAVKSRVTSITT